MALPVLVVDDSGMSRKLTIRALPAQWDVELTQAANGHEALAAYRQGRADVMFLDLTMPDMNGYQVLEALQQEGMNSFVIVVTADIQPQAELRVKQLGAMAFLRKPVRAEEIERVLREFGFL
jgi:two-component system, chemotaxis family, chemotaxis protein CheY